MTARLTSGMIAGAIRRQVEAAGGTATVLAKGDDTAGAILLVACEKGRILGAFERILGLDDSYRLEPVGPQDLGDSDELDHYLERRRRNDPDLWLIELDIVQPARFIVESLQFG
jgi:hypothetical protein